MAIGTTPLFSKISGSVGPVDYRTRRNGKIEIGKKRIPANPQSTRQLEVRAGYGRLHELWQNASYIDKAQYERLGKLYHVSAWNAFLLRHQSAMSTPPVSMWGLVENSNSTLHDITTNENHSTIFGASWNTIGAAQLSILNFDGIDDHMTALTPNQILGDSPFSIFIWIKYTLQPHRIWLFTIGPRPGAANTGLHFLIQTNGITQFGFWAGTQNLFHMSQFENIWTLLTTTYDPTSNLLKSYINSNKVDEDLVVGAVNLTAANLEIGNPHGGDSYYKGLWGESFITNSTIDLTGIQKYYNATKKFYVE